MNNNLNVGHAYMLSLNDITSFDVIVVLLFSLFVIRGTWVGFMRQLAVFVSLVASYIVAGRYTGLMMPHVEQFIENPKAVFFISFGLLFVFGSLFLFLFGKVLNLVMQLTLAGWFDRLLGFMLGVVKGVFVTSFLYMVMNSSLISTNDLLTRSVTSQYLAHGAAYIQEIINDPEVRELFLPREPAIKPELEPGMPVEEIFEQILPDAGSPADDRG